MVPPASAAGSRKSRSNSRQNAALHSSDPNNAIAENRVIGTGRDWNFLAHAVGGGVDPTERAVLVCNHPDAIVTRCDPTLWACWCYRDRGADRVLSGIDPDKFRFLPAERNPNASEPGGETGAGFAGHTHFGDNPVRCGINSLHGIRIRARHPNGVIGYQNPICGSTK